MLALIRDDDAATRTTDLAVRRLMELAPLILSRIMA